MLGHLIYFGSLLEDICRVLHFIAEFGIAGRVLKKLVGRCWDQPYEWLLFKDAAQVHHHMVVI